MARTRASIFCAILLLISLPAFSQRLGFGENYGDLTIDFPAGFQLQDSNSQGTAFQLQSTVVPVSAVVRIYESSRYSTPTDALNSSLKALGAKPETEDFSWRNQNAAIANFSAAINRQQVTGYGLSVTIPNGAGTVVLIAWCAQNQLSRCHNYMLSFMDGLIIDEGSYFEAGPVTSYLYPKSDDKIDVDLEIAGKKIRTNIRSNDKEASEYTVDREYQVLSVYAKDRIWQTALERYYRMIFKDSYGRLMQAGFDIFNEIYPDAADDTDLAQKLLTWTQGMKYERERTTSDFTSLPAMLLGDGSDCDSRALILCVLLTQMNQDAVLLVSPQFSHAMTAITSDHPGHSFKINGKDYLMGETTAQGLTWGKIDEKQDDQRKWMAISFF